MIMMMKVVMMMMMMMMMMRANSIINTTIEIERYQEMHQMKTIVIVVMRIAIKEIKRSPKEMLE